MRLPLVQKKKYKGKSFNFLNFQRSILTVSSKPWSDPSIATT